MDYILDKGEDYKDFTNRTLKGQVDDKELQLFNILLEIIVSEIGTATYSIIITVNPKEIITHIIHRGKTIKKIMLAIIDHQVDYLYYHQQNKDSHILTLKTKRNANEPK
ncbi:MAG: hypothetical protein K5764_09085 [Prevotella sp.]|nr:hypothetical protein [Prevotella sp.]